ncbi:MAG: ComEC/Rec2 family competence protein, partial [Thermomicrobiales bacterium]
MGIAVGLGTIFGVRAVSSSQTSVLSVIALLLATAVVTQAGARNLCVAAVAGCMLGVGAGMTHTADNSVMLKAAPEGAIVGEISSDLDVRDTGAMAQFTWRDVESHHRRSVLFLPPAPIVGRGDGIEVSGEVSGATGELIFADGVRLIDRAGWIEMRRRSIRKQLTDVIQRRVPGTPGALTLGLLIGDDSALTVSEREDLQRAGLSHLTAVSGWNVTLVTSA